MLQIMLNPCQIPIAIIKEVTKKCFFQLCPWVHAWSRTTFKLQSWFKSYDNIAWGCTNRWIWKRVELAKGGPLQTGLPCPILPKEETCWACQTIIISQQEDTCSREKSDLVNWKSIKFLPGIFDGQTSIISSSNKVLKQTICFFPPICYFIY